MCGKVIRGSFHTIKKKPLAFIKIPKKSKRFNEVNKARNFSRINFCHGIERYLVIKSYSTVLFAASKLYVWKRGCTVRSLLRYSTRFIFPRKPQLVPITKKHLSAVSPVSVQLQKTWGQRNLKTNDDRSPFVRTKRSLRKATREE